MCFQKVGINDCLGQTRKASPKMWHLILSWKMNKHRRGREDTAVTLGWGPWVMFIQEQWAVLPGWEEGTERVTEMELHFPHHRGKVTVGCGGTGLGRALGSLTPPAHHCSQDPCCSTRVKRPATPWTLAQRLSTVGSWRTQGLPASSLCPWRPCPHCAL